MPNTSDVRTKPKPGHQENGKQQRRRQRTDVIERQHARDQILEIEVVLDECA